MPKYHITELTEIRDGPLERFFFGWGGGGGKGAGEVQKKIHACREDQEKKFLHWPSTHFTQISIRQAGKQTVCKTAAF